MLYFNPFNSSQQGSYPQQSSANNAGTSRNFSSSSNAQPTAMDCSPSEMPPAALSPAFGNQPAGQRQPFNIWRVFPVVHPAYPPATSFGYPTPTPTPSSSSHSTSASSSSSSSNAGDFTIKRTDSSTSKLNEYGLATGMILSPYSPSASSSSSSSNAGGFSIRRSDEDTHLLRKHAFATGRITPFYSVPAPELFRRALTAVETQQRPSPSKMNSPNLSVECFDGKPRVMLAAVKKTANKILSRLILPTHTSLQKQKIKPGEFFELTLIPFQMQRPAIDTAWVSIQEKLQNVKKITILKCNSPSFVTLNPEGSVSITPKLGEHRDMDIDSKES